MSDTRARQAKPATIYDVARLAEVSHQTVALYLRGHEGFRESTRKRVEDALVALNYRPNLAARSLARSRSNRIGALVYELAEVGPSKTIQGASAAARAAGYLLDVISLDPRDESAVTDALAQLGQQDLAGILAFAPLDLIAERIATVPFNVPVIQEADVDDGVASVGPNAVNAPALTLLVDHLVGLGHRSIFHLAGPSSWSASRSRLAAFEAALAVHGLASAGSLEGDWSAASGYAAAMRMPLDAGVTAIVAANDQMAIGALLALEERGLSVPGDMSVTGFDDIPEAAFLRPPLTTVSIDYAEQGRTLVTRLLAEIDPDSPVEAVAPPPAPVLIARASTAVPNTDRA